MGTCLIHESLNKANWSLNLLSWNLFLAGEIVAYHERKESANFNEEQRYIKQLPSNMSAMLEEKTTVGAQLELSIFPWMQKSLPF